MAKKKKESGTAKSLILGTLLALAGGLTAFFFIAAIGSYIEGQTTANEPTASQTVRGTLPSSAPIAAPSPSPEPTEPPVEPSNEPEPDQTVGPVQQTIEPTATPTQAPTATQTPTATPTPTRAPTATPSTAPVQNPGPVVSINPTAPSIQQTQTPAQSSGQSGGGSSGRGNANNFDTYDNAAQQQTNDRWVLNTSSMKIHYPTCSQVRRIAPQNYATSNADLSTLKNQNYTTCGVCFR